MLCEWNDEPRFDPVFEIRCPHLDELRLWLDFPVAQKLHEQHMTISVPQKAVGFPRT